MDKNATDFNGEIYDFACKTAEFISISIQIIFMWLSSSSELNPVHYKIRGASNQDPRCQRTEAAAD